MKKLFLLSLIFCSVVFISSTPICIAATPDEIRQQIQNKMTDRHPTESATFWSKLGPEAVPVIQQMYSETKRVYQRSWLVDGLGYFQDKSVGTTLETEIAKSDNEVLKRKMLASLLQSQGDEASAFVEPYLKDQDAHTRLTVAQAMKKYAWNDRNQKRLAAFEANEKLAWVKADYQKTSDTPSDQFKREGSIYDHPEVVAPSPTPMPEKAWAGQWKGVYVTPAKTLAANLTLKLVNEKATPAEQKWKIELKLPKQSLFEIKEKNTEIVYYQTAKGHWLEIRNKKEDSVFIAQKKEAP